MSWKSVLSFVFFLVVMTLLTFYWILPIGNIIEFGVLDPGHSNFTINDSSGAEMQFYMNMRYVNPEISYAIGDCSIPKVDEMKRAISTVQSSTVLRFYEVGASENPEIDITCQDTAVRGERGAFIAGEGGVTNVTPSGEFNVVFNGKVLLIRETQQCSEPLVGIHELLHALGFDHSDNPNNVMYPTVRCGQEISEDLINYINWIYSFPTLPDLSLEDTSASIQGGYLDVSLTIRNKGLKNSEESRLIIFADGKEIKDFVVEPISIGSGRIITLTNIRLPITQRNADQIELYVEYNLEELNKNNNRVTLIVKNIK